MHHRFRKLNYLTSLPSDDLLLEAGFRFFLFGDGRIANCAGPSMQHFGMGLRHWADAQVTCYQLGQEQRLAE